MTEATRIVIRRPGGYERLEYEKFSPSPLKEHEVLVKTKAIGVNYADCCVRWGVYKSAKEFVGWPICPGFEYSGIVEAVGSKVTRLKPGQQVMGVSLFNAYSTHVTAPEHQVFALPEKLNFAQAGGFQAVYLTAYHALFQNFITRPGMEVLVHSAAGGVGSALLQLGKNAGFRMTGVVGSSHKVEACKSFGADYVIDKSKQNLWKEAENSSPKGFDLILDANGHTTLKQGFNHLKPTGKLVTYGYHTLLPKAGSGRINYFKALWGLVAMPRFNPMNFCDSNKSLVGFNLSFLFDRPEFLSEAMEDLVRLVDQKKISPSSVQQIPFQDAAQAHRLIESGQTVGKLVLMV